VTAPSDPFDRERPEGEDATDSSSASSEEMIEDAWMDLEEESADQETGAALADEDTDLYADLYARAEVGTRRAADSNLGGYEEPADPFADTGVDPTGRKGDETEESIEALRAHSEEGERKRSSRRSFWKELPILILIALVVAILIKTFLVQVFSIPSGSMEPTLQPGDRVMVNKLAYRFGEPARGDLIVFDDPRVQNDDGSIVGSVVRHVAESLGISSPQNAVIKRIIGLEGETVEIIDSTVYVDGVPLDEPYVAEANRPVPDYGPFTVPAEHVFVMGDNRNKSTDSRVFGPISEDSIVGRAFVRVWPIGRWGGL
jgi:signal peptidase I